MMTALYATSVSRTALDRIYTILLDMLRTLIAVSLFSSALPAEVPYPEQIAKFRAEREQEMRKDWLPLVGLYWLKEGDNAIGSNPKAADGTRFLLQLAYVCGSLPTAERARLFPAHGCRRVEAKKWTEGQSGGGKKTMTSSPPEQWISFSFAEANVLAYA